jgi:hypothetical protein
VTSSEYLDFKAARHLAVATACNARCQAWNYVRSIKTASGICSIFHMCRSSGVARFFWRSGPVITLASLTEILRLKNSHIAFLNSFAFDLVI